jgi:intracellular sulfur oxidation DsrE/DsrF family protein
MVVYGDAIPLLRWDSPVANRVKDAISEGVKVVACKNSMNAQQLTSNDMGLISITCRPASLNLSSCRQQAGNIFDLDPLAVKLGGFINATMEKI